MTGGCKRIAEARNGALGSRSSRRRLVLALLTAASLIPAAAQPGSAKTLQREPAASHAHVYLMRGLMNIFSLGMDDLAAKLQGRGVDAAVYNHAQADEVVTHIAAEYRAGDRGPIILIGHSLGADAVMMMAQALNRKGVPVSLVIPFDGTGSYAAPKNVACVYNLTQREYAYMRAGAGFRGKLSNIDLRNDTSIDHFTIDKSPRLQAYALNATLQAANSETCRPAGSNPTVAKPTEPGAKEATPALRPGVEG